MWGIFALTLALVLFPSTVTYVQPAVTVATAVSIGAGNRFTTETPLTPAALPPFSKIAPAHNSTGLPTALTLSWETSSGATSYEYCHDTTDNNSCDSTWVAVSTATSAGISGLSAATEYYWQVRATDSVDTTDANDGTWWRFTTGGPPSAFSKLLPANGATDQPLLVGCPGCLPSIGLFWQASNGATSYRYCIDTTNNNSCDTSWYSVSGEDTWFYHPVAMATTYYWQVEAQNAIGTTSANGGTWWQFTTEDPAFTKLDPSNGSEVNPEGLSGLYRLSWEASSAQSTYYYCLVGLGVRDDPAGSNVMSNNDSCHGISVGTQTFVYVNLGWGGRYTWQVEAVNIYGRTPANAGTWWTFTTAYKVHAVDDAFVTNVNTALVVAAPGVLANDGGFGWPFTASLVSNVTNGTLNFDGAGGFTYAPNAGFAGTDSFTYRAWGDRGPSNVATVTITVNPTAFSKGLPANGATAQPLSVTLTWQASSGATSYRYCLDTTNDNGCDTAWTPAGTALSAPVSGLAASTTYYWQVEAQNAIGPTPADGGEWWAFMTDSPPAAFNKHLPANGATAQPLSVTLTWQASSGATSYRYCRDTTNNNSCDGTWISVGTALSTVVSGLAASTTYYWQVEAQNAIGSTPADSEVWWAFTTDGPPAMFDKRLPANGATAQPRSLTLSWEASSRANGYRYCVDTTNNNSCDSTWSAAETALSAPVSGLATLMTYYWQVEAQNALGTTAANGGEWWAFTTTAPLPSTVDDAFATNFDTMLVVAAPGVLTNDNSNGGGALAASFVSTVSHGTLNLAATGAFTYTPNVGFFATDTFTYRATSSAGQGNVATVTITVNQPTAVQPPTELYAASIVGDVVTLRWKQPVVGPVPSGYVIEGGLNPSEVIASLPTGSSYPIVTFVAPTGAFYVRAHAIRGTERSGASNEIRLFVNVLQPPSAPASLLGMVNGSSLRLTWRNTYEGGAASSMFLDVSGPVTGSLPLALAEGFTVNDIPVGTYSLCVRARNASGSSDASNVVTVTVPNACSGPPLTPANFIAHRVGNTISAAWDPADSGAAPASFVLSSTGSFSASIPTTSRKLSATAPSGSYALSVIAINECGSSAPTAAQIVIVP